MHPRPILVLKYGPWFARNDTDVNEGNYAMRSIAFIFVKALMVIWVAVLYPAFRPCHAAEDQDPAEKAVDFTKFSLEELKNVQIISVSKKPEMVSDVAAAVYVITKEDIRRSGATSIPEALRLAPGVHVARISATDWAVNIRGLNNQFAQNLLVLIDGRSVYTHVFSGVFWDIQDTVMEDIDRIEVIRGPGAALWGANAVNGVINIITKRAKETQGGQAVALGGSEEQIGSLRYGGTLGEQAFYRAYGKFFNRGELRHVGLSPEEDTADQSSDNWRSGRGGFRVDRAPGQGLPNGASNSFTLQGEAYSNRYDKEFARRSIIFPSLTSARSETSEAVGWHMLGRWQHTIAHDSETILQLYYDFAQKDYDPGSGTVGTADLDFQHRLTLAERHEVVWGLEYKFISDEFDDSPNVAMAPRELNQSLWSTFIHDEIVILPQLLTLIAGSKFEHNEFTGLEIQPSIRMLYTPYRVFSLWAAVSRAVRVPSRLELHGRTSDFVELPALNPDGPVEVITQGNSGLSSEKLIAYELGLRLKPAATLWLDTTLFFNDYDRLVGLELNESASSGNQFILEYKNNTAGEAYGLEVVVDWKATAKWLLGFSYTYLHTQIEENQVDEPNLAALISEGSNPRHLFSIRSSLDITPKINFDLWFRFVSSLPERDVDKYSVMDARLAWKI
ncbi:MAG: TonB-dependent receptor, partial [Desulfobacteraceae bacterium]